MDSYVSLLTDICMQGNTESVLEMLYLRYQERHPVDTEEISRQFAALSHILDRLPLQEHDRLWDLICTLCVAHERNGFREGVRTGVSLAVELMGRLPQQNDQ